MGGITIFSAPPEQVVVGRFEGTDVIVLSVKDSPEAAEACWRAACGLVTTFREAGSESQALIVDIANAQVRHGYVTRMEAQ